MPGPSPRERNEAAVIQEIVNREDRVQTYPFEIQFSGEHRCNLRCIQCGATIERNQGIVPLMDQRLPLRSLERFKKLQPQIPSWQWLSLTGSGETLINPDLPGILQVLGDSEHECQVAFNTNGTLWTRDKARLIVESGVDEIRFSMDGATKATFERIRVNAKLEKVLDGIRTLISVRDELGATNPRVAFSCNFMRGNIEELPALVELAAEVGATQVIANNTIIYAPEMESEALSGHRPLVRRMLSAAQQRAEQLGIGFTNYLLTDAGEDAEEAIVEDVDPAEPVVVTVSSPSQVATEEPGTGDALAYSPAPEQALPEDGVGESGPPPGAAPTSRSNCDAAG